MLYTIFMSEESQPNFDNNNPNSMGDSTENPPGVNRQKGLNFIPESNPDSKPNVKESEGNDKKLVTIDLLNELLNKGIPLDQLN